MGENEVGRGGAQNQGRPHSSPWTWRCRSRPVRQELRASTGRAISGAHVAGGRGRAGLSRATQGRWCPAPGLQTPACGGWGGATGWLLEPGVSAACTPREADAPVLQNAHLPAPRGRGHTYPGEHFQRKKQKTGMKSEIKVLELVQRPLQHRLLARLLFSSNTKSELRFLLKNHRAQKWDKICKAVKEMLKQHPQP